MSRPAKSFQLKHAEDVAYSDVTDWVDAHAYTPPAADLQSYIATATVTLVDPDGTLPIRPREGDELILRDDGGTAVFGGWIADPIVSVPGPGTVQFKLIAQSWESRFSEVATGSLNKSLVLDTDRNFVIAAVTDALQASALDVNGDGGYDDSILVANEATGWEGIQGTAFLYGTDWSYKPLADVLRDIVSRVPGVSIRVRPDKTLEYGVFVTPAPYALAAGNDAALMGPDWGNDYVSEVLADSPVAYYRLGEMSGTVAKDSSGNGRDGTYVGGVSLGRAGFVDDDDPAILSDGTTGYVDLGDVAALKPAYVSAEVWVRTTDTNGMLVACPTGFYGYDIWIDAGTGKPRLELDGVNLPVTSGTSVTAINDGRPHHLVGTYDGARGKLYVDAVLVVDFAYAGGALQYAAGSVCINNRIGDSERRIAGTLDEVAIYDYALSADRIAAHYAAAHRRKVIEIDADGYEDEVLAAGHYNKLRLGGAGAAEATAYDTVSIGRYGRVRAAPYTNDENIAAADVLRSAYAKLETYAERRVVRVKTTHNVDSLEPGQVVPVLMSDVGCLNDEGWHPTSTPSSLLDQYVGTPWMEPAAGYRGELLVQKVTPSWVAPGVQSYDIELGSYIADFDRALAVRIGGA